MKYLNKFFLMSTVLTGIVLTNSCSKDFLDINNDPNRVTESNITAPLIFTGAEVAVGARQASGNFQFLDHWMGYFAPNGDFAPNFKEQTYDLDFSFGDALFQNHYNVLFDLNQVKAKSLVEGGDTVLAAASMILSAKLFQELVDLYGDIPYSQAFQVKEFPRPAYDKAQDIYNSLLSSLDTAVNYMTNYTASSAFKSADVINNGDQGMWIKFANTLRLRLLIRQSQVSGFSFVSEIAKIGATGGVLKAGESVGVNPGYVNDIDKQNPFYANYGYTPVKNKSTTSDNANSYIIALLSSNNDPRLSRFFQPVGGKYVGGAYGDKQIDIPLGSQSSYFGPGLIGANLDGGAGAAQDQWIMPSFESMFLYAEAVARGWIAGDTKQAYESAVTESFRWIGVPDAETQAQTYLTNSDIAVWNPTASTTDKINKIILQKYIAMTGIDPLEAYSDERRLNFLPAGYITKNSARMSSTLPVRLLYPQIEYTTNGDQVKAEGDINQFTSKIFWQP